MSDLVFINLIKGAHLYFLFVLHIMYCPNTYFINVSQIKIIMKENQDDYCYSYKIFKNLTKN